MHSILVLISVIGMIAGFLFLSQATQGVGILAIAILFAAWARIAQANKHHAEVLEKIDRFKPQVSTPKESSDS
jgi:hypothetical protein